MIRQRASLTAAFIIAASGAYADDRGVLTITTSTTTRTNTATFAQMENIGLDFVERVGLGGPPTDTSSSAARVAREFSRGNGAGVSDAIATGLGLAADNAVMRREIDRIRREQDARNR